MAASWHWGNTCLLVCKCMGCYEQFLCLATGDTKGAEYLGTIPLTLALWKHWVMTACGSFHTLNLASYPRSQDPHAKPTSKLPIPTSEMCSLQTSGWLLAMPHPHTQAVLGAWQTPWELEEHLTVPCPFAPEQKADPKSSSPVQQEGFPRPLPAPQPHRGVLALQAGAVEAQSVDTGRASRDVKEALIPTLARLWLRQVPGSEGNGLHHAHWHVDLGGGQDLRAVLGVTRLQLSVEGASKQVPHCGPDCNLCAEPVLLWGKHHRAHFIHWKTEDLGNRQLIQRQEAWVLHLPGYVAALCALGQALPTLGSVCSV